MSTVKYYGSDQPVKIARCDYIPFDFSRKNRRRYWGLYNDPGNRLNTNDMVKERVVEGYPLFQDEQNDWASGVSVESEGHGLILVKESNKTVNNYGHQTGAFYCTPGGDRGDRMRSEARGDNYGIQVQLKIFVSC